MRKAIFAFAVLALSAVSATAQTADSIVAKYIKTVGGMEKIQAVKALRRTGKIIAGGGFEIPLVEENKRPNLVRRDITIQGLIGSNAYDGKTGWKIAPWQGKKDAETMGEAELKSIVDSSEVEGTDTLKLKVTMASGEVQYFYLDTDYYVPIKIATKRVIRGAEVEIETVLGDYKEVDGWYIPHSVEVGAKGSQFKQKIAYEKIEANLPIDERRFSMPTVVKKP